MGLWIKPDDKRWSSVLRQADHDFHHLPCYTQAVSDSNITEACAYFHEGVSGCLLMPTLLRKLPSNIYQDSNLLDATSPYGYAGPVVTRHMSDGDVKSAIQEFIEFGADQGLVTTFLRLHPLLSSQLLSAIDEDKRIKLVNHGPTVSIDLALDIDTLNRSLRKNHKRDIKKLKASGFQMRLDYWDDYQGFQRIYHQTMARVDAGGYYFFDKEYFQRLKDCLGASLHLCTIISPKGDIAAAGLFTHVGNIVQYHLGGTAEDYLSHASSKLMFYEIRNWAKDINAKTFHLGGGLGAERDSLFMFKRGFSTHEHIFQTLGIIHNIEVYQDLVKQWLHVNRCSSFPDQIFFPLYRSATTPMDHCTRYSHDQ